MKNEIRFNVLRDEKRKYRKQYEVLVFNYEDASYAQYVRRRLADARALGQEKMQCQQVRAVQINEMVILETPVAEFTRKFN